MRPSAPLLRRSASPTSRRPDPVGAAVSPPRLPRARLGSQRPSQALRCRAGLCEAAGFALALGVGQESSTSS
eukprot:3742903-Alexandrium_andersonii.AAC.1